MAQKNLTSVGIQKATRSYSTVKSWNVLSDLVLCETEQELPSTVVTFINTLKIEKLNLTVSLQLSENLDQSGARELFPKV